MIAPLPELLQELGRFARFRRIDPARLRIVTGDATFDEVRAWFGARLRPL